MQKLKHTKHFCNATNFILGANNQRNHRSSIASKKSTLTKNQHTKFLVQTYPRASSKLLMSFLIFHCSIFLSSSPPGPSWAEMDEDSEAMVTNPTASSGLVNPTQREKEKERRKERKREDDQNEERRRLAKRARCVAGPKTFVNAP